MAGDITNDELARRLADLRGDLRDDLGAIHNRLSLLVPREVYDAHRAALEQRVATLEKQVAEQGEQRRATNRYVVSAIALPILAIIVQILLSIRGVTP